MFILIREGGSYSLDITKYMERTNIEKQGIFIGPIEVRVLCAGRIMQPRLKNFGPSEMHAQKEQQAKLFKQNFFSVTSSA